MAVRANLSSDNVPMDNSSARVPGIAVFNLVRYSFVAILHIAAIS